MKSRDTWRKLLFQMAGGVVSEYEIIKGLDIMEFWASFDIWRDKLIKETKNLKTKK